MKTKEILADMISGTFDVEACASALKVDARTNGQGTVHETPTPTGGEVT